MRRFSVLLALLALAGCAAPPRPAAVADLAGPATRIPAPGAPDILLVSIDTLRPDHLGARGYPRATSPVLDALIAQSVFFSAAYSHASWTPPSVASLFTAQYPPQHGSLGRDNLALADRALTIAEVLAAAGYCTAAYSASPFINPEFGFGQGFMRFGFEGSEDAARLYAMARADLPALRRAHPGRPVFAYLMFFDPHFDYRDHPGITDRFRADVQGFNPRRALRLPSLFDVGAIVGRDTFESLRAGYDGEIRYTDDTIASLLADLDSGALGLDPRNTILVFTSDHGEEFLEHAGFGHGNTLYDEAIRVLLLVRRPGRPGARVDTPVRQIDVAPTLLGLAGVPVPAGMMGRTLAPLLAGETEEPREVYASSLHLFHQGESQRCLRAGGWKLIVAENPDRVELYDLDRDPAEQQNLAPGDPDRVRELSRKIAGLEKSFGPAAPGAPSARALDLLRRLGYIQK